MRGQCTDPVHVHAVYCSLRENSVGLFDTSDPNPLKWKKKGVIKDPLWKGEYPKPFHMAVSAAALRLSLTAGRDWPVGHPQLYQCLGMQLCQCCKHAAFLVLKACTTHHPGQPWPACSSCADGQYCLSVAALTGTSAVSAVSECDTLSEGGTAW